MQNFPEDFKWGVATAAYQIEGAVNTDGRGPSIWDIFSHTPGKITNGDTGDVACDHYHRWQDDIALMRQLGVNAYRFSVAWSRVLPTGVGAVNEAGMQFYDHLVDALLDAGIAPVVTLYHWDLPQVLEDQGGWTIPQIVDAFAQYTEVVVRRLGDRVKQWVTFNEPQVFTFIGYATGRHAPGKQDLRLALKAVHYALLAHGHAVPIIRRECPNAEVGITLNLYPAYPATDTLADKLAAHYLDMTVNRIFLDPIFGRGYPQDVHTYYGDLMPEIAPTDAAKIGAPIDFLGVNYYFPQTAKLTSASENPNGFRQLEGQELIDRHYTLTEMGWPVDANGLGNLLTLIHKEYAPKAIYITENGAAFPDQVVDGKIDDPQRTSYLADHLSVCQSAIAQGIPLKGYFLWSLMDNFEWAHGFSKRFGVIYTDYATLARIPKRSFYYYQRVIAEKRLIDSAETV